MVPQPQIYIAKGNFKNLGGPMSILNIMEQTLSRGMGPWHPRVSYGSGRSASLFIPTEGAACGTRPKPLHLPFRRMTSQKGKQIAQGIRKKPIFAPGRISQKPSPSFDLRADFPDLTPWRVSLARLRRSVATVANLRANRYSKFWEHGFSPGFVSGERPLAPFGDQNCRPRFGCPYV